VEIGSVVSNHDVLFLLQQHIIGGVKLAGVTAVLTQLTFPLNDASLGELYFTMIGRADLEGRRDLALYE